ncbi:HNH endonuclease [Nocardioides rubriscoriae]|uniref:HNH endonuclease n=1 Tax=Nocardioides rubriscoriae TaxID=642762 RepID=UPI0011DFD160|nr:HNH endonuclease [Nocardioides rubriscoriae]
MTGTQTFLDPALAAVAQARDWKRQGEVAELVAVLDWTGAHQVGDALVATPGLRLGGVGCPVISEFDTWDLSCVLGQSADSCTTYVGNALELRHRLPRLWQRVLDLQVPVWRAFRITARTQCLPPEGVADVDRALAHCAESITLGQVERTIAVALATHNPAEAEDRRKRADEARCFDIDLTDNPILLGGTVEVHGVLDLADALDLDAAITATATQLADLGNNDPLDVRRAAAAGEIARGQLALDLTANPDTDPSTGTAPGRGVTLYAHVNDTDVATVNGTPVLVDQLITWCTRPGVKVTIKPVIDLNADLTTHGYVPDARLAEQVDLRDRRCVFPVLHPPPHRPRPHPALRPRHRSRHRSRQRSRQRSRRRPRRRRGRPDPVVQPRPPVPRTPPRQDLQSLVLRLTSPRGLPVAIPGRYDLPRRPHHRTLTTPPRHPAHPAGATGTPVVGSCG